MKTSSYQKDFAMPVKPLITSVTGLALLAPATYFAALMGWRILFGIFAQYRTVALSLQSSAFDLFRFHGSQLIIYGPLLAVLLNLSVICRLRFLKIGNGVRIALRFRHSWLNAAVALEAFLLLLLSGTYLLVEAIKW